MCQGEKTAHPRARVRGRVINGPDFLCPSKIHLQPGPQALPNPLHPSQPVLPTLNRQVGLPLSSQSANILGPPCRPHSPPPSPIPREMALGFGAGASQACLPLDVMSQQQSPRPMARLWGLHLVLGVFTEVTSPPHPGHRRESPNSPREKQPAIYNRKSKQRHLKA